MTSTVPSPTRWEVNPSMLDRIVIEANRQVLDAATISGALTANVTSATLLPNIVNEL